MLPLTCCPPCDARVDYACGALQKNGTPIGFMTLPATCGCSLPARLKPVDDSCFCALDRVPQIQKSHHRAGGRYRNTYRDPCVSVAELGQPFQEFGLHPRDAHVGEKAHVEFFGCMCPIFFILVDDLNDRAAKAFKVLLLLEGHGYIRPFHGVQRLCISRHRRRRR